MSSGYYIQRIQSTGQYGVYSSETGNLLTFCWRKRDARRQLERLRQRANRKRKGNE